MVTLAMVKSIVNIDNNGVSALVSQETENVYHVQNKTEAPIFKNNKKNKSQWHKEYYQRNKINIKLKIKQYQLSHKKEIREYQKIYRNKNIERIVKEDKQYYIENKERILKQCNQYNKTHKELRKFQHQKYYQTHKEQIKIKVNKYRQTSRGKEIIKKSLLNFSKTIKGKENSMKQLAKRKKLGFVLLNKPFPGSVGHHINNKEVVNIPKKIHLKYSFPSRKIHRKLILQHYGSLKNMIANAGQLNLV